jgi:hypothetical protein
VGPRGSLLQAPAGGLGADFKTTPSWGGRSSPLGPNGDAAGLPSGLVVRRYKRRTAYRTTNFDVVVRLVAELLHRVAVSSRGNVYYLNGRRMRMLLSLDAPIHPIDLSVVYEVLSRLGFEVVEQSRGKYVVIRMDNPIMREVKGARSFDEILEIVKKHLNNGE